MIGNNAITYFPASKQRFCTECGQKLFRLIPPDDNKTRAVCQACGAVHYQNPLIVTGTLPIYGDQVLLCRRAIEPRAGYWTLPAGFMELGETTEAGARRETAEEAGAPIEIERFFALINIPDNGQVHSYYLARLLTPTFNPGPESLEVRLFPLNNLPWEELSFTSVIAVLKAYLSAPQETHFLTL